MRAALILGRDTLVRRWQYDAVRSAIPDGLEIVKVLHCTNDFRRRLRARNAAYYALVLSGRRRLSMLRDMDVAALLPLEVESIAFESEWEGMWQRLPFSLAEQLSGIDIVVKFGMNLLRDPHLLPVRHGVLSYHHGDPEKYRGRPAGFYEMQAGEAVMGIIVQRLSNSIDGGDVLARAHSRVIPYSYSSTLNGAYQTGIPLLGKAMSALTELTSIPMATLGKNHTLPTNSAVVRSVVMMSKAKAQRAVYGAFREKRWKVGRLSDQVAPEVSLTIDPERVKPISVPNGCTFVADPVGLWQGKLYCEAMSATTGRGKLAAYIDGEWIFLDVPTGGGHLSYPQIVEESDRRFLFPEMAQVDSPTLFSLDSSGRVCEPSYRLIGLEGERLIDGTLHSHGGRWFLFAGFPDSSWNELHLWVADDLMGPWRKHPKSPVCLDPRNARMAGPIMRFGQALYRPGQDGSVQYGHGVTLSRIEKLSPTEYSETAVSRLAIQGAFGPHTVLAHDDGMWLDYYTEKWTPLAGLRRLRSRFAG